jgi:hypothetical protein
MSSRSYSPENEETDRLRMLAIEAVGIVIERGHPSALEKVHSTISQFGRLMI